MATFRIKRFTRADKNAIKQLYKKTDGFRHVVDSSNLKGKDLVDFHTLMTQYEKGGLKGVDRKKAKRLLNNAGLNEVSEGLDHLIDKYSNNRTAVRYRRRYGKAKKIDDLQKTINLGCDNYEKEVQSYLNNKSNQKDRIISYLNKSRKPSENTEALKKRIEDIYSKSYDKGEEKIHDTYEKMLEDLEKKKESLEKELKRNKSKRNSIGYNIYEGEEKSRKKLSSGKYDAKTPEDFALKEEIKKTKKKYGVSVIKEVPKQPGKHGEYIRMVNVDKMKESGFTDEEIRKKILDNKTTVYVRPDASAAAVGHEYGHSGGAPGTLGNTGSKLGREAIASGHSIAEMKKGKSTTKRQLKLGREELTEGFNTYHQKFLHDIKNRLSERYLGEYSYGL